MAVVPDCVFQVLWALRQPESEIQAACQFVEYFGELREIGCPWVKRKKESFGEEGNNGIQVFSTARNVITAV
jgi:hypothetical protein